MGQTLIITVCGCEWEMETENLRSECFVVRRDRVLALMVGRRDRILALINTMCMCVEREDQLFALIIIMCVCGKRLRACNNYH